MDMIREEVRKSIAMSSEKLQKDEFESQLPCQITQARERSLDSQLDYSAEKVYYSNSKQSISIYDENNMIKKELYDESFLKRELKEMQDICLENQKTMMRIGNKYFRAKSSSHYSSGTQQTQSSQQVTIQEEKHHTDLSHMNDYRFNQYTQELEVSDINKNQSMNQDLSLLNCERVSQAGGNEKTQDLEHKIHVLMSENLKLSKMNETLFREVEQLRDNIKGLGNQPQPCESREIILKNTQIQELQRRVFEAERTQIERLSEDYAQYQSLERKVQQLTEANATLQRQLDKTKDEKRQVQQDAQQQSNLMEQLEEQLKNQQNTTWGDTDRDEYMRLKSEFEEFQRLTQNIINQEEEYQRRICELEEETNHQGIVQEELVIRIRESEEVYQQRMQEMKEQYQNELDGTIQRIQDSNDNIRDQNLYLYEQLQQSEQNKQALEDYFVNEIESLQQQSTLQCLNLEQQLKRIYEKQLQDKNYIIQQLQEQVQRQKLTVQNEGYTLNGGIEPVGRSKSLSACGGLAKHLICGIAPSSKSNYSQNYYLPPYRANISLEEEQFGRIKQNSSIHNNSILNQPPSNNQSFTCNQQSITKSDPKQFDIMKYQRKPSKQASVEKENNLREWEKSAIVLSQEKQKEQYIRDQYTKQRNTLYLRQLDGEFKYSPNLQNVVDSRTQNNNSRFSAKTKSSNTESKQFNNESRGSLLNAPPPKQPLKQQSKNQNINAN